MTAGRKALFVGTVVALFVALSVLTGAGEGSAPGGPPVPSPGATGGVGTWYCAEGSGAPDAPLSGELVIGNVGQERGIARITVLAGPDVAPATREVSVDPGRAVRVAMADLSAAPSPGVVVETRRGRLAVEHEVANGGDVALGPCARAPARSVSFAAGTTTKDAQLWLALFNPFPDDAIVDVSALTGSGPRSPGALQGIVVPRQSRVSVAVHTAIPRVDLVAVHATARRGRFVAEQSLLLDGSAGPRGLALSLGSPPARDQRFPFGLLGSGHDARLVLVNPAGHLVRATVSFALDAAAGVEPLPMLLPAQSVTAVDLSRVPPDIPFSMRVRASRPIVAESLGTASAPQAEDLLGIATDPGLESGSRTWVVVPGRLATTSTDTLAIVSTDGRAHRATIALTSGSSRRILRRVRVPAVGRALVDLGVLDAQGDRAFVVRADGPVVVGRESTRPGLTRSHAIEG